MSQGNFEHPVMSFGSSRALQGSSSDLLGAPMDDLPAFSSSSDSSNYSSSIEAPEEGLLPAITEDYLRLGFVSNDRPSTNHPTEESSSLLASDSFSNAHHLNPSALNTKETPYDVGDMEQRVCDFYRNNFGRFFTPRSPYIGTSLSINTVWSSGSSSYTLFDGSEASSSRMHQVDCRSGITGPCFSYGRTSLREVSVNPLLNTLSGGSGFHVNEVEAVRDLVMRGPINPSLGMIEQVLPHLLSLMDDGDILIQMNIMNGVLRSSSLYRVMKDKHGHHLFMKLLDKCSYMQKLEIVSLVTRTDKLLELAKDCNGNCSVKKLIVSVKRTPELCYYITSALSMIVSDLMIHTLGFSLIECCLEHLTYNQNSFIFKEVLRNCHWLARNQKGVFILKLCIEKADRPDRVEIVEELVQDTIGLAHDTYGNFAIQFLLDLEDSNFAKVICSKVAEHLAELSLHKTGSYVVERCLESSEGRLLLQKLENFTDKVLEEISTHPFGNYVLQAALKVEKGKRGHHNLACRINKILRNLRSFPYAINVLKRAH